jgi:hypothetical protein
LKFFLSIFDICQLATAILYCTAQHQQYMQAIWRLQNCHLCHLAIALLYCPVCDLYRFPTAKRTSQQQQYTPFGNSNVGNSNTAHAQYTPFGNRKVSAFAIFTGWPFVVNICIAWQRQQLTVFLPYFPPGNGNDNQIFSSPEASYSVEAGTALSCLVDPGKKPACFT